ncbi:DUF6602 domain-containing protein [Ichthyobacterium seriolicida]|uniref:DUF6602 domain-containing protein n=1 Tax=Ichthyobacterium seriolicida TaxID=242600 RepID=A0A1J1DYR4_9FLAO|nr:DUF6602 domain-containing protein [Ichthyobacterium seriolicida]BAV95041.1 hypothetical protein JBKA6_1028 [Ichthyobacterium seriolicida]
MSTQKNLKDIFHNLQKQMLTRLNTDKDVLDHAPTKGAAAEVNWIDWLKLYLPSRYEVDQAFIIDHEGNVSEQIDLVIYDQQYSPFVFNQDTAIFIPAESVYAVFEIKPELDKGNFEYAQQKINSVRSLKRTSVPIVQAGGDIPNPKPPNYIIGGVLTSSSGWKPPFGDSLKSLISGSTDDNRIDIGCCLKHGGFEVMYEDGKAPSVLHSTDEESLIYFFLRLLDRLQRIGTVRALDINEYAKALDSI